MKGFERKNQLFSLCGLNCGLCPMFLGKHCGGCGNGNQSCGIAKCSLEHGKIEYCYECESYPCEKYRYIDKYDSFITHKRQKADLKMIQDIGVEQYNLQQREKMQILSHLLANYNDGRRKNFFCVAVNLLELSELQEAMKQIQQAVIVDYWKRIPKESFQNWYKSQSRYRTKEDREKDALLEDATITMPEMAQLLGTTRSSVYTILDNPKYSHFFEFIVIAEKKRITKESFQKFLKGQDRYKLDPSNDYEELAQEQNIALANYRRKKLSQTGIRGSNGNIKYLTFDEASYLAKVSRSMINKWADTGKFTVIKVGSRVRIRRDEFEDWMEQRDLERSMQ